MFCPHHMTIGEVEQVCHSDPLVREGYLERVAVIGSTLEGRILAIVLERVSEGNYYVVTARPADRKERRLYREGRGSEEK